jgi:hypothetical protein
MCISCHYSVVKVHFAFGSGQDGDCTIFLKHLSSTNFGRDKQIADVPLLLSIGEKQTGQAKFAPVSVILFINLLLSFRCWCSGRDCYCLSG